MARYVKMRKCPRINSLALLLPFGMWFAMDVNEKQSPKHSHTKNNKMREQTTKRLRVLAASVFVLGMASTAQGQVTASATATAVIVTPIAITKTVDMSFGNVAVSPTNAGTVILAPAGTRTLTGGVTLPFDNGTVTAATFKVDGQGNYTYAITLPTSALTITSGLNTMTVTAFESDPSGTGALSAGTQNVNVGATLNVAAGQPAGTYLSATPFDVTVNYN
jgi:hypothetical protein